MIRIASPTRYARPLGLKNDDRPRAHGAWIQQPLAVLDVTPALFEAGTDAVPWRERGIPVYGVYPYPITRAELADMHGNDERISIRRLEEGTDMLTRVVRGAAAR